MKFNIKKNGIYSFAFATAVQSNASKVLLGSLS